MSSREKISLLLSRSGLLRALEQFPSAPGLIVFNHHRIGDQATCEHDRELFSATAEQFDYQLSYIKRHFPVILPCELAELIAKKKPLTHLHAMITFDDGYLDNYTLALPLLKQHGLRAAFFLVSTFVGTSFVPWWDEVAYLVRNTPKSSLSLEIPHKITVNLEPDRESALYKILYSYKSEENRDPAGFMQHLRAETGVTLPPGPRRFLNWDEAREMAAAGMEIGAHTHTHPFLSRLTPEQQQAELRTSKRILEENMGRPVTSLAYPNGTLRDFSTDTKRIAHEEGYTTAYSFYGGANPVHIADPYDVLRGTPSASPGGFRVDTILMSRFSNLEPTLKKTYRYITRQ